MLFGLRCQPHDGDASKAVRRGRLEPDFGLLGSRRRPSPATVESRLGSRRDPGPIRRLPSPVRSLREPLARACRWPGHRAGGGPGQVQRPRPRFLAHKWTRDAGRSMVPVEAPSRVGEPRTTGEECPSSHDFALVLDGADGRFPCLALKEAITFGLTSRPTPTEDIPTRAGLPKSLRQNPHPCSSRPVPCSAAFASGPTTSGRHCPRPSGPCSTSTRRAWAGSARSRSSV
jgi:hypothetical protein